MNLNHIQDIDMGLLEIYLAKFEKHFPLHLQLHLSLLHRHHSISNHRY